MNIHAQPDLEGLRKTDCFIRKTENLMNTSVRHSEFVITEAAATDNYGCTTMQWTHPDFGIWTQQTIDLGFLKVEQNRSQFKQKINVTFDEDISQVVHHCISVEGLMGAHVPDYKLNAQLNSLQYHNMFLSDSCYHLSIDREVVNVHIEIDKDYYCEILPINERWANDIRDKILKNQVYYPGDFALTPAMVQSIYTIFNSPLTGPLKKMLVEAKVQELLALQLFLFSNSKKEVSGSDRNLMHDIRDYLDKNFLLNHSLKSICQQFAINEFKLKSEFKQCFNTTVFDYVWSKKMDYAHNLLADHKFKITDVAQQVGYQHSHHFSSAFKRRYGYSPSALLR